MSTPPLPDFKLNVEQNISLLNEFITKLNSNQPVDFSEAQKQMSLLQESLLQFIDAKFRSIKSSSDSDKLKLTQLTELFSQSINLISAVNQSVDTIRKNTSN